jgi:hypothetical protein
MFGRHKKTVERIDHRQVVPLDDVPEATGITIREPAVSSLVEAKREHLRLEAAGRRGTFSGEVTSWEAQTSAAHRRLSAIPSDPDEPVVIDGDKMQVELVAERIAGAWPTDGWTKVSPPTAGWYWLLRAGLTKPVPVELVDALGIRCVQAEMVLAKSIAGEWAGPLSYPPR